MTTVVRTRLLTVADVARELRCSERTVRRLIRDRGLPALQFGGPGSSVRIDTAELERWLHETSARS
jgi:excisionase family DNA binding protein